MQKGTERTIEFEKKSECEIWSMEIAIDVESTEWKPGTVKINQIEERFSGKKSDEDYTDPTMAVVAMTGGDVTYYHALSCGLVNPFALY